MRTIDTMAAHPLTPDSTNEEICKVVLDGCKKMGHMHFGTVAEDGKTPTSRVLEIQFLDDTGIPYIGFSEGKPLYAEIMKNPQICGTLMVSTDGRRGYSVRLSGTLTQVDDDDVIYEEYWRRNKGTYALYIKSHKNFKLFRMLKGDGELFDLCADDVTHRYRFAFGEGALPRPWYYNVTDSCIGCGACASACMMEIISLVDGKAVIDHRGCLECGLCYESCPVQAITKG